MPMGFLNLDENIIFQYISFTVFVVILVEFVIAFLARGLTFSNVPVATGNIYKVFGIVTFSYGFVIQVPSWYFLAKKIP